MAKHLHTVKLPDGTTATRESESRVYTHAVIIERTQAEIDAAAKKDADNLAKLRADVAALEGPAADPVAAVEFAAAQAAYDHLHRKVREFRLDKETGEQREIEIEYCYTAAFRVECGDGEDYKGLGKSWEVQKAAMDRLHACPGKKLEWAKESLERTLEWRAKREPTLPGFTCENWSQSAGGAAKLAEDVRKHRPLAKVTITSEIEVKTREPKTSAKPRKGPMVHLRQPVALALYSYTLACGEPSTRRRTSVKLEEVTCPDCLKAAK